MGRIQRQRLEEIARQYPSIGHLRGKDLTGTMIDKLAAAMYKARWGESVAETLAKAKAKAVNPAPCRYRRVY